jgi:hypothetical protein
VLNWSISRDDKVKLTKCQNHHHHGGVFDRWTKWVRPQAERARAGRPAKLLRQPAVFYFGLAHNIEDTCLHEE